jgi:hypothetical protein
MPILVNPDLHARDTTSQSKVLFGNSKNGVDTQPIDNNSQPKSPPIDIHSGNLKEGEIDDHFIWTPPQQLVMDPRHLFSTGKHTIITDTNLSASTDDLLKLATGGSNRSKGDSPVPSPKDNTIEILNQNGKSEGENGEEKMNGLKDQLNMLNVSGKTSVCRYFQSGFCRSGDHCPFSHGAPIELNNVPTPPPKTKTKLVVNSGISIAISRY